MNAIDNSNICISKNNDNSNSNSNSTNSNITSKSCCKHVTFRKIVKVKQVRGLDEYTPQEFEDIWFSVDEVALFRQREQRLSKDATAAAANNNKKSKSSSSSSSQSPELGIKTMIEITKRRVRINTGRLCVMKEQRQHQKEYQLQQNQLQYHHQTINDDDSPWTTMMLMDPTISTIINERSERIAKAYSITSFAASKEAKQRGKDLELELVAENSFEEKQQQQDNNKKTSTAKKIRQAVKRSFSNRSLSIRA